MNDGLKLTSYFGERDRAGRRFLADALIDIFAAHELQASLLIRGVEGFGVKHHLRSDRLLTLSEDLPLAAVAVDNPVRVQAALHEVEQLHFDGLLTLERARVIDSRQIPPAIMAGQAESDTKLTIYIGRHQRIAGRPGYQAIVERCRRSGLAAATVLLGVDGTYRGVRHRARFIGRNADVPLMVIALGGSDAVAGVLPALVEDLEEPLLSLERVRVCKREGRLLRPPHDPSHQSSGKLARWQKITVYADESSRHDRRAQHLELIHALRRAGASGATSLRGVWGFHGDQDPHGDSFWQLHRGVPMMTVIIDSPERVAELFGIVDQLTEQAGVVTSELVPAFRATGPGGLQLGGLELAEL